MCSKYRIIIVITITISQGQIFISYISNTSHKHTVLIRLIITHYTRMGYVIHPKPICMDSRCRRIYLLLFRRLGSICRRYDRSCRLSDGSLAINGDYWRSRFIQQNARGSDYVPALVFGCFSPTKKIARTHWVGNSWEEGPTVDTNTLWHLPRRPSKKCDLPFANSDKQI